MTITAPAAPAARTTASEPLRIGMIAPPWFELPPRGYGGTEAVVAALVDQLVARGHEVTLVASGPARTRAQRHLAVYEEPPSHLLGRSPVPEVVLAAEASRLLDEDELDIVHDNSLAGPLLARSRRIPTVATMHGPVTGDNGDYFRRLGDAVELVAISDAQRRLAPDLNWVGTVHNAIDVASFTYNDRKDDELLWIGRFSPDKGAHLAIDAARAAGRRILLAGKLNEREEHEYFDEAVRPRLGPDAEYLGEADARLKRELFARAAALVFPIQWEEPFGMVMAEAMASGTPVVATRRGSVPEVVEHGVTGWIVDDPDELPGAIDRALELDPADCRARAERCFDLPVMAAGYERVYRALLEAQPAVKRADTQLAA
ncbi:MAG: glycosyltransferase family 4 protein [Microbacteriaceae bacterium]|nr:MAG: glycosyltransferase family 4 protein [Microbacteriaceae bacterium]